MYRFGPPPFPYLSLSHLSPLHFFFLQAAKKAAEEGGDGEGKEGSRRKRKDDDGGVDEDEFDPEDSYFNLEGGDEGLELVPPGTEDDIIAGT